MPKLYPVINTVLVLVSILYPFIWYFGQKYTGVIPVAVLMALIWLLRALLNRQPLQKLLSCAVMLLFIVLAWLHSAKAMYWYPVMVSALLLLVFGASLYSRQSLIGVLPAYSVLICLLQVYAIPDVLLRYGAVFFV